MQPIFQLPFPFAPMSLAGCLGTTGFLWPTGTSVANFLCVNRLSPQDRQQQVFATACALLISKTKASREITWLQAGKALSNFTHNNHHCGKFSLWQQVVTTTWSTNRELQLRQLHGDLKELGRHLPTLLGGGGGGLCHGRQHNMNRQQTPIYT